MRSRKRQDSFGKGWWDTAYNALLVRDGAVDLAELAKVRPNWTDPATPTPAAQADAAVKLIQAGVLPADSTVTYGRIGLSDDEQRQLVADRRRAGASTRASTLAAAAVAARRDPAVADLSARRGPAG